MKKKFLLVDDDADDNSLLSEAVMQIGPEMDCRTVENGRELFQLLSSDEYHIPDVIFLDINMPVMNGWECLIALKQDARYKDIPTIMYSTSDTRRDVERAYALGALLFLTKPENFDELCQILELVAANPSSSLSSILRGFSNVKML